MRFVGLPLGLWLITVVVYWPATQAGFINFDDPIYVTENPQVRAGLTSQGIGWALYSTEAANWHPLTWLSHMLDVSVWGASAESAWGHHLTSILLHATNSALLLCVLVLATGRTIPSAIAAALFAWHPLHVESVAWISERKDVLSACFFLLTLLAYVWGVRRCGGWKLRALPAIFLALGLAAKPMLVTTPFVLLLLDYWPLGRWQSPGETAGGLWSRGRSLLVEKLPLLALVAISCVITLVAQSQGGAVATTERLPLEIRLANASVAVVRYLDKLVWPNDLAVFYPYRYWTLTSWPALGAIVFLLGVTTAVVVAERRSPRRLGFLPVGWFWYLGMLVPVVGIVQVGSQSLADRYTYLPLIGIYIASVWSAAVVVAKWPSLRPAVALVAAGVLAACILTTRTQIAYWHDSESLYRHALEVTTGNTVAHANLGSALLQQGFLMQSRPRIEEAAEHYRQALQLDEQAIYHNGLATAAAALGDYELAVEQLRAALRMQPDSLPAMNNLAWLLATCPDARVRNADEAVSLAEHAARASEFQNASYLDTLAAACAAAGRFEQAVQYARMAIERLRQTGLPVGAGELERLQGYERQQPYIDPPVPLP